MVDLTIQTNFPLSKPCLMPKAQNQKINPLVSVPWSSASRAAQRGPCGCPWKGPWHVIKAPIPADTSVQARAPSPQPSLPVFVVDDWWLGSLPTHLALIISTQSRSDANNLKTKWLRAIFLGGWKCPLFWWGCGLQGYMLWWISIQLYPGNVFILPYVNVTFMIIF